jgi:ubiquitin-conjugating enzyme E2 M
MFGKGSRSSQPSAPAARVAPGLIRIQSELTELDLPPRASIDFPDPKNLMEFRVTLCPDEGYWKNAKYVFSFSIKPMYPHDAPKVKCLTTVYHPNIDLDGNVCLNILREEWNPVLSISAVIYGLLSLFIDPNPTDPLNQEAAEMLRNNKAEFARVVSRTLRGTNHQGKEFPRLI